MLLLWIGRTLYIAAIAIYSAVGMSHIGAVLLRRKELHFVVRSSELATASGMAGIIVASYNCCRFLVYGVEFDATELLLGPLSLLFHTGTYYLRYFRLVVMYHPEMRARWGRYLGESTMVRVLVASFVVVEVIVWSLGLVFGVNRVASSMTVAMSLEGISSVVASATLILHLRSIKDLFKMSVEIRLIAACVLVSFACVIAYNAAPLRFQRYGLIIAMNVRYHGSLWFTNIQPLRAVLRSGPQKGEGSILTSMFPYLPWRTDPSSKVAVDMRGLSSGTKIDLSAAGKGDDALDSILHFPPLLEVFEGYCQKALCSESLMFLLDAEALEETLRRASTTTAPSDCEESPHFETFVRLVDKYIRDGSPLEVNVDSRTKREILDAIDSKVFHELTLDDKCHILARAVKEIRKVLTDNLCSKFQLTQEYKDIKEQMLAAQQLAPHSVRLFPSSQTSGIGV